MTDTKQLFEMVAAGDSQSAKRLLDLVYDELRRMAAIQMAREAPGQTLSPTALVHEAYLRLVGREVETSWSGRGHFICAAAEAMRRILVEQARRKGRIKHGGKIRREDYPVAELPSVLPDEKIIAVDEAIGKLALEDAQLAEIVKMRFFLAMTNEEIAEAVGISEATVKRRWRLARAWLARELDVESEGSK